MLKAAPGSDPSLLKLTVRNASPETASVIANSWAELFVSWANRTYGDSGEDQLEFFEQRLEDAAVELQEAEQTLVEFQGQNRSVILENELQALQQTHADLLAKQGEINLLFQDIESLLALSQSSSATGSLGTADPFTALVLKLRAFGGPPGAAEETFPWQLQVNTEALAGGDQEQQIRNLQEALEIQVQRVETALAEIEPEILAVQKERQEADATESLMLRNVLVAEDTHTALARTVEEKRITSEDTNAGVNLVSRSVVPTAPVGPRKTMNSVAAAAGTVFLTVLVIILATWWRSSEDLIPEPRPEAGGAEEPFATTGLEGQPTFQE
jgi:uncharacterized protein involved in exopolysaccharide biosynthesis